MRGRGRALSGLGYAATLAACGTPSNPGRDAGPADAPTADAGPADTGPVDAGNRHCRPDAAWSPAVSGERAPTPPPGPRPLSPVTSVAVTTRRPTLRWVPDARWPASEVRVCGDPACSRVEATQRAQGAQLRLEAALSPGLHFWSVRGFADDGAHSAWSATWSMHAPPTERGTDSASLFQYDADGDGRGDLVLRRGEALVLYLSQATGVAPRRQAVLDPAPRAFLQVGDPDGDGTSELATSDYDVPGAPPDEATLPDGEDGISLRVRVTVHFGDRQSPWRRRVTLQPLRAYFLFEPDTLVRGGYDFNDDGYGDLSVWHQPYSLLCEDAPLPGTARLLGDASFARYELGRAVGGYVFWPTPVGDYDGDGVWDYFVGVRPLDSPPPPPDPRAAPRALHLAEAEGQAVFVGQRCDFDGDGRSDLVLRRPGRRGNLFEPAMPYGPPQVCLGNAARTCTPITVDVPASAAGPTLACLGDVTGDGRSELYVHRDGRTTLYELGPDGRFAQRTEYPNTAFREVGDTNGDGRGDVLIDNRLCTEGPPFSAARCVELPDAP